MKSDINIHMQIHPVFTNRQNRVANKDLDI